MGAVLDPRPGELDLIDSPVAQPVPEPEPAGQIASREADQECDSRDDDDGIHHDHRMPMVDSCSIRSGVSVAALLR